MVGWTIQAGGRGTWPGSLFLFDDHDLFNDDVDGNVCLHVLLPHVQTYGLPLQNGEVMVVFMVTGPQDVPFLS